MLFPVGLYAIVWAFLWGGLLERFATGRRIGIRAFARAGLRRLPAFVAIAAAAALIAALLYLTVHRLLLGPMYEWGAARAGSERNAFFWRVGLYLAFGTLLATISLAADYARVASALELLQAWLDAQRAYLQIPGISAGAFSLEARDPESGLTGKAHGALAGGSSKTAAVSAAARAIANTPSRPLLPKGRRAIRMKGNTFSCHGYRVPSTGMLARLRPPTPQRSVPPQCR